MTVDDGGVRTATITVRYWAAARAAAGRAEETTEVGTLDEIVARLGERHGDRLGRIFGYCSFLVDGAAVRDSGGAIPAGSVLEVLPPFAGG
ncbi:MAG TPA: MoaD/ThiS family protein [Frankiaceae bacterium]|nr:MoaD/ThiS family protein [Frankiaceae bacterium]